MNHQLNELQPLQIITTKSSNPEIGEIYLDKQFKTLEIYTNKGWKIVQQFGEWQPSLLDHIIELIEQSNTDKLRKNI